MLLNEPALKAEVRSHGRHLSSVVALNAADRHERVCAAAPHIGDDVLQLANLVAAECQATADVLAFGPDAGTAEVVGEPVKRVDRARAEGQLVSREIVKPHDALRAVGGLPDLGGDRAVRPGLLVGVLFNRISDGEPSLVEVADQLVRCTHAPRVYDE